MLSVWWHQVFCSDIEELCNTCLRFRYFMNQIFYEPYTYIVYKRKQIFTLILVKGLILACVRAHPLLLEITHVLVYHSFTCQGNVLLKALQIPFEEELEEDGKKPTLTVLCIETLVSRVMLSKKAYNFSIREF